MDGSPQVVRFDETTLWHFDAAEWAPSTASYAVTRRCRLNVRFGPLCGLKSDICRGPRSATSGPSSPQGGKLPASAQARRTNLQCPIVDKKKPGTRYPRVRASHSAVEDVNVPA